MLPSEELRNELAELYKINLNQYAWSEDFKQLILSIPLIEKIEKAIRNNNVTFFSFFIQACEYALENMENEKKNKNNTKDAE